MCVLYYMITCTQSLRILPSHQILTLISTHCIFYSYPLAKKTDDFIITVVSGYDIVPRATIRGLGHLVLSVADMIENSKHKKQSVLCCTGCFGWEPKIDTDVVEERLEAALQELKVPKTDSEDDTDSVEETDQASLTTPTGQEGRGLGKQVLKQLTRLAFRDEVISLVEGKEEERAPMTFNPGRILHLEVESVDHMKRLVRQILVCCHGNSE